MNGFINGIRYDSHKARVSIGPVTWFLVNIKPTSQFASNIQSSIHAHKINPSPNTNLSSLQAVKQLNDITEVRVV